MRHRRPVPSYLQAVERRDIAHRRKVPGVRINWYSREPNPGPEKKNPHVQGVHVRADAESALSQCVLGDTIAAHGGGGMQIRKTNRIG